MTASRIHPAPCSLQPPSGPWSSQAQQFPQSQGPRHSISLRPARNLMGVGMRLTTCSTIRPFGGSLGRPCNSLKNQDLRIASRPSPRSPLLCFMVTEGSQRSPTSSSSSLCKRSRKTRCHKGEPGRGLKRRWSQKPESKRAAARANGTVSGKRRKEAEAEEEDTEAADMSPRPCDTQAERAERRVHRPGNTRDGWQPPPAGTEHTLPQSFVMEPTLPTPASQASGPGACETTHVCFRPLSVWSFITAAPGPEYTG